jgi:hypothetical protein
MVCSECLGRGSFYRLARGAVRHGKMDGGDGATAAEGHGRGARTVRHGLAVLVGVMAQQEVAGWLGRRRCPAEQWRMSSTMTTAKGRSGQMAMSRRVMEVR